MVRYQRDILGQRAIDPEDVGMSASRFYVPTLPGMPLGSTLSMYAGEIPSTIDQTTSSAHLFFFLIRNKHISGVPRLLLWFNGGAGEFQPPLFENSSLNSRLLIHGLAHDARVFKFRWSVDGSWTTTDGSWWERRTKGSGGSLE